MDFEGYEEFKSNGEVENKNTPFYNKSVAIIGYLDNFYDDEDKAAVAFLLWEHGAAVTPHVTPFTDIVVSGIGADEADYQLIDQLKKEGEDLKVIFQEEFECMLHEYHLLDWYSRGYVEEEQPEEEILPQTIKELHIDEDLRSYLFSKGDVEKFINFCIRERKEVIEKNYKKPIAMSEERKDKSYVDPAYRKFLPDNEINNRDTLFYHRNIVITGTFIEYEYRNDLAGILHSFGAAVKSGISSKTDIVIMGNGAGPKKKEEIKELIASGHFIRIIEEQELKTILDKLRVL